MDGISARSGWVVLGTLLLTACAAVPQSAFEVTGDCQVRQIARPSAGAPSGFSFGFGGVFGGRPGSSGSGHEGSGYFDSDVEGAGYEGSADTPRRRRRGVGLGFDLGSILQQTAETDYLTPLLVAGPGLPAHFSMSCLGVQGLVKGGWPIAIEYLSDGSSMAAVEIHVEGIARPMVVPLENARGRHLTIYRLPVDLGTSPRPALVLVRSSRETPEGMRRGWMQLYGLAAGPRAVASIAIEQVDFGPPLLQPSAQQLASYSFFAKADFNSLAVGVLRLRNVDGEIQVDLAREFRFGGGISRGTRFGERQPRTWDGTDASAQVSRGSHLLQVRAWMSTRDDANWVTAWSEGAVRVAD